MVTSIQIDSAIDNMITMAFTTEPTGYTIGFVMPIIDNSGVGTEKRECIRVDLD